MLQHSLDESDGILTISPQGPLTEDDFKALCAEVDPFVERAGALRGFMIDVARFPGWDGFAALTAHLRFVRDHHREIRRVALVTDSSVLSHLPALSSHFVQAEVRHFPAAERDAARDWLRAA